MEYQKPFQPIVPRKRRVSRFSKLLQPGSTHGGYFLLTGPYHIHARGERSSGLKLVVSVRCVTCGREKILQVGNLMRGGDGCLSCSSRIKMRKKDPSTMGRRRNLRHARKYPGFGEPEPRSLREWVDDPRCVVAYPSLVNNRIRGGWSLEEALTVPVLPKGARHRKPEPS